MEIKHWLRVEVCFLWILYSCNRLYTLYKVKKQNLAHVRLTNDFQLTKHKFFIWLSKLIINTNLNHFVDLIL